MQTQRYEQRKQWWANAFRTPNISFNWIFAQAKTWVSAILAILNPNYGRNGFVAGFGGTLRRNPSFGSRSLSHEPLEGRQLLAANIFYVEDLGTDLTIDENGYVGEFRVQDSDENGKLDIGEIVTLETPEGLVELEFGKDAFGSIQDAIASVAASTGDSNEIVIAPGTYSGDIDATAPGKDVTLRVGGSEPGVVTIEGSILLDSGDTISVRVEKGGTPESSQPTTADTFVIGNLVSIGGASIDIQAEKDASAKGLTVIKNNGDSPIVGRFEGTTQTPSGKIVDNDSGWRLNYNVLAPNGTPNAMTNQFVIENQAPVILSGETERSLTETEDPNQTISVKGLLNFSGLNYDNITFAFQSVTFPSIGSFGFANANPQTNSVEWVYTVDNAAIKHLGKGQQITRVYNAIVRDERDLPNFVQDSVRVTIVINGINDAPEALGGSTEVLEDGKLEAVELPFNDPDKDDTHTFAINTDGTVGTVSVDAAGKFTYDPAGNFDDLLEGESKLDSFTYTVTDQHGATSTATFTVEVKGKNSPPVAQDVELEVNEHSEGVPVEFKFTDVDSTEFVITVDTTGTLGQVIDNGDGTFFYTPAGEFEYLREGITATDSFTYTVTDSEGESATATVLVTVIGENDAPIAGGLEFEVDEDSETVEHQLPVNFVDQGDEDEHTYEFDLEGTRGTVIDLGGGKFSYSPNGAFDYLLSESATDTFTYTVKDPQGLSSTATVTITVNGVDSTPIASDFEIVVAEDDGPMEFEFLVDYVDENDTHTFEITTSDLIGVVTILENGKFTYDPNGKFGELLTTNGEETFTYTVKDAAGNTSQGTVKVTITPVDSTPIAGDLEASVDEDSEATTFTLPVDFVDVGDTHTYSYDLEGLVGEVTILEDGQFSYSPAGRFNHLLHESATDTFRYTVKDAAGNESTGTVVITIEPKDSTPIALETLIGVGEDDGPSVWDFQFDAVDEGDTHVFALVGDSPLGLVEILDDGKFSYSPNGQFEHLAEGVIGTDVFTFSVTDAAGNSSTQIVTVTITGANDAPVTPPVDIQVGDDGKITGQFEAYDVDEGDTLSYAVTTEGTRGIVTVTPDGTFSYDPNGAFDNLEEGEVATDTFVYIAKDNFGAESSGTVSVTVVGSKKSPNAVDDNYSTAVNTTLSIPAALGILSNDSGFRDRPITVSSIQFGGNTYGVGRSIPLTHGHVVVQADGSFTYMPSMFEGGQDVFSYTVTDGTYTSTANTTITIRGTNNPPIAIGDYGITDNKTSIVIDVLFNDFDQDFDELQLRRVNGVDVTQNNFPITQGGGRVTIVEEDGRSKLRYTPSSQFNGLDQFSYLVTDGRGGYAGAEVFVTVGGVIVVEPIDNTPPIAIDDAFTVGAGSMLALDVLSNDSDEDTPKQTLTIDSIKTGDVNRPFVSGDSVVFEDLGTLYFVSSTGVTNFYFEPFTGAAGQVNFSYVLDDLHGGQATANVTIDVVARNTDPVANDDHYEGALPGQIFVVSAEEGVRSNDSEPEFDGMFVTLLTQPVDAATGQAAGMVSLMADGSFTFMPLGSYEGTAEFTYMLVDSRGGVDNAKVTVVVGENTTPEPSAPALEVAVSTITEDAEAGANVGQVSVTGLEGPTFSFQLTGDEAVTGLFAIDDTGAITLSPELAPGVISAENSPYIFNVQLNYEDGKSVQKEVQVFVETESTPTLQIAVVTLREDAEPGSEVGKVTVVGLDAPEHDFVLLGDEAVTQLFSISETGVIQLSDELPEGAILAENSPYTFQVRLNYGDGKSVVQDVSVNVEGGNTTPIEECAPRVVNVFVTTERPSTDPEDSNDDFTGWSDAFKNYVHHGDVNIQGIGYPIPKGASQLATLPWANINQIVIEFDQDIVATPEQVLEGIQLAGTPGTKNGVARAPMTAVKEAIVSGRFITLITESSIPAATVELTIADGVIKNADGVALDGEWTNGGSAERSGDGQPGGAFEFKFNVLPGDANGDGIVDSTAGGGDSEDELASRLVSDYQTRPAYDFPGITTVQLGAGVISQDAYSPFRDFNGNLKQGVGDRIISNEFEHVTLNRG